MYELFLTKRLSRNKSAEIINKYINVYCFIQQNLGLILSVISKEAL